MFAFEFAVAEDPDYLAACGPRHGDVFKVGLQVVRQDDEGGELVRIDEESDALDIVLLGIGETKRFKNHELGGDVAHGKLLEEPASDICGFEVTLTVQEVVGHVPIPSAYLFTDSAAFIGIFIAMGEEATEAVDATRERFVAVAEPQANPAAPATIGLAVECTDPTFLRDCSDERHYASPPACLELEHTFGGRIAPNESDGMVFETEGIDQFRSHGVKLAQSRGRDEDRCHQGL